MYLYFLYLNLLLFYVEKMGICGRLQLVKYKIEHLEWDIRTFPYVLAFTNVIIFQKKKNYIESFLIGQ